MSAPPESGPVQESPATGTPITFGPYDYMVPQGRACDAPLYHALSQYREFLDDTTVVVSDRARQAHTKATALLVGALRIASVSARAAQVLCMHNLAEQGMVHVRTICEWVIRVGYVLVDRELAEPLARRWFAFKWFPCLRYALAAEKDGAGDDPERLAKRIAVLKRGCEHLDRLLCFPGKDPWSKEPFFDPDNPRQSLNLFKMAAHANQQWLYTVAYTQANDAVHAGPMALVVHTIGNTDDGSGTLVAASLGLEHLLFVADDFLGLGIRQKVDVLHRLLGEALKRAQELDGMAATREVDAGRDGVLAR